MTSADHDVIAAMFCALGGVAADRAGMVRLDAANPNGIQGIRLLAIDELAYLQHVEPALRAGKVQVVEIGRSK